MAGVHRVLISVTDKTGIVEFAGALSGMGMHLLSTGGTARLLRGNAIRVTEVSDYTGFPEIMDGRVKTLHPKIHGALLGRRAVDAPVMAPSISAASSTHRVIGPRWSSDQVSGITPWRLTRP